MRLADVDAFPELDDLRRVGSLLRDDGYAQCQFVPFATHTPQYVAKYLDVLVREEQALLSAALDGEPVLYQHSLSHAYHADRLTPRQRRLADLFLYGRSAPFDVVRRELPQYAEFLGRFSARANVAQLAFRMVPVFGVLLVADPLEASRPDHVFLHGDSIQMARYLRGRTLQGKAVADVGTGSGILALAAHMAGASRVMGVDINPRAVECARLNASLNGVEVNFWEGSIGAVVDVADVIVSNPPYMVGRDALALDGGGRHGLDLPLHFVRQAIARGRHLIMILETRSAESAAAFLAGVPRPPSSRRVLRRHGERELAVFEFGAESGAQTPHHS